MILRNLSIPLLIVTCTVSLIWWAFPEGLSTARTLGIVLGVGSDVASYSPVCY